jgi:hypothetical protein
VPICSGTSRITPDFSSIGPIGFPNGEDGSFLSIMHAAFRAGLVSGREVRLRWRLKRKWGELPRVITGRSAEVAAACSVRALMNQTDNVPGPLLDERIAITASLGQPAESFEERPIKAVNERTLDAKFQAAAHAELVAVLVQVEQSPARNQRSILIQPVATLGEAYDNLLVTSGAIRAYKKCVCDTWRDGDAAGAKGWIECPTPQEFIDVSQRE